MLSRSSRHISRRNDCTANWFVVNAKVMVREAVKKTKQRARKMGEERGRWKKTEGRQTSLKREFQSGEKLKHQPSFFCCTLNSPYD